MKDVKRNLICIRGTRRSVFTSFVSLLLCISMLLGTTFAWFTDTVTSANNVIASGTLDIELYHANAGTNGADKQVSANTKLFDDVDSKLWEPGAMTWEKFTVTNEGSLNLKYLFTLNARNATVVDGVSFASMLKVAVVDESFEYTRENVQKLQNFTSLETFTLPGNLGVDGRDTFGIVIWWQPGANDNLFNMNNDRRGQEASIEIGVSLVATQASGEMDSFDTYYDDNALFPKALINMSRQKPVTDKIDVDGLLTETVLMGSEENDLSASVPAGVQLAEGVTELNLTVQTVQSSEANVEIDDNSAEETVSIDVHMDGVAIDNTIPMQIALKEFLRPGLNDNSIRLYHVENGEIVQMTPVAALTDLNAHNQFYYNTLTGDLVLSMATFSEVAVVADGDNTWDGSSATAFADGSGSANDPYLIANASQLAYFRDLVDGGKSFEGEYVKLASNIELNAHGENVLFDPIGWGYSYAGHNRDGIAGKVFKGTFDGDNHYVHGLYQNGWDLEEKTGTDYTYTNCGGGLFASVENATIKNLIMLDASIIFECVEIGIVAGLAQGDCTFENIFVYDSTIGNYQRATGGIVGEVSPSLDADGKGIECTHVFKNIVIDTSVTVASLWGDFDTPVGGVIGARWDDDNASSVNMENVNVACRLDVYNDVTSTYQWYAYRRAGMLIGNTDTPPADGKNAKVATADFLTCSDVNVYYTEWAKYNYCQFTNYNSSWPWVRVQGGSYCQAYSNPRYGVPTDKNGALVTGYSHVHQDGDECNVPLYFDQLYGGGQGVYGQSEHPGVNTDVKYLVTFMDGDSVIGIEFVTDNSSNYKVEFPDYDKNNYEWLDRNGKTVVVGSEYVAAGNTRDVFYYLTDSEKYYVRFIDKDGFIVDQLEFNPKTGAFVDSDAKVPTVPSIPDYNGIWESYTLKDATSDVIVNAVYSKSENATVLTNANELFGLLGQGKELSMSQDLSGKFGSASQNVFCTVVGTSSADKEARVDLNSFTLVYNGDSNANKDWILIEIKDGCKFTVGSGVAGFGLLNFNLTSLNGNATPCIFNLEKGATLVLERGVVIEMHLPNGGKGVAIKGVSDYTDNTKYPGLDIVKDGNVIRITVTERTVLVGDT